MCAMVITAAVATKRVTGEKCSASTERASFLKFLLSSACCSARRPGCEEVGESCRGVYRKAAAHGLLFRYKECEDKTGHFDEDDEVDDDNFQFKSEGPHVGMKVLLTHRTRNGFLRTPGKVEGYLAAASNEGMALWHVRHDDGDEEDLEEHEVEACLEAFESSQTATSSSSSTSSEVPFICAGGECARATHSGARPIQRINESGEVLEEFCHRSSLLRRLK